MTSSYLTLPRRTRAEAAEDIVREYLKARARDPRGVGGKDALAAFNVLHPPVQK